MLGIFNNFFGSTKQSKIAKKQKPDVIQKIELQVIQSINGASDKSEFDFSTLRKWRQIENSNKITPFLDLDVGMGFIGHNFLYNCEPNISGRQQNQSKKDDRKKFQKFNRQNQVFNVKILNNEQKTVRLNEKIKKNKQNVQNSKAVISSGKDKNQNLSFSLKNNTLKIGGDSKTRQNKIGMVLEGFKFPLMVGNELKIGNNSFQVIQLSCVDQSAQNRIKRLSDRSEAVKSSQNIEDQNQNINQKQIYQQQKQHSNRTCKYCLGTEDSSKQNFDLEDILISPCKCKGSCSYVHLKCLKTWIVSRVVVKMTETVQIFDYSKLKCELCKYMIPLKLQIPIETSSRGINRSQRRGQKITKTHSTINILENLYDDKNYSNSPYILLRQLYSTPKDGEVAVSSQRIMKLKFPSSERKSLKVGRSSTCQLQLQSKTVSRQHCEFQYNQNKKHFYIKDLGSRFGTQVEIDDNKIDINQFRNTNVGWVMLRVDSTIVRIKIE